jgi:hypothetical protein
MKFMGPKKNPKTYIKISNYPKGCNKNSFSQWVFLIAFYD